MHEHHIAVGRMARYVVIGSAAKAEGIQEVWFVLHGYGQLAAAFVRPFETLDDGTRLIVAPEALNRFYLTGATGAPASERPVGATWMTREDREHEIADYVAYLDAVWGAVTADLTEQRPLRLTVLGFSQGTATAARWASLGAARPTHLVLWGGLLPPELDIADPAHRLRHLHLRLVIGSNDGFVSGTRLAEEESRMQTAGLAYEVVRYNGGHGITRDRLVEIAHGIGLPNG